MRREKCPFSNALCVHFCICPRYFHHVFSQLYYPFCPFLVFYHKYYNRRSPRQPGFRPPPPPPKKKGCMKSCSPTGFWQKPKLCGNGIQRQSCVRGPIFEERWQKAVCAAQLSKRFQTFAGDPQAEKTLAQPRGQFQNFVRRRRSPLIKKASVGHNHATFFSACNSFRS